MKELLLFQIGTKQYGMELPLVKGIHRISNKDDDDAIDKNIPVYDLHSILMEEQRSSYPKFETGKLLLVDVQGQSMALKADRIDGVVSVDDEHIEPMPPVFKGHALSCFPRVLKGDDRIVLLIDPQGIIDITPLTPEADKDLENILIRIMENIFADGNGKKIVSILERAVDKKIRMIKDRWAVIIDQ